MRVFRWMSGVVTEDKIRNEYVRDSIGVVSVNWYGLVMWWGERKQKK